MGYVFCVYEENKAVIGDVFALPGVPNNAAGSQPGSVPRKRRCSRISSSCCSTRLT